MPANRFLWIWGLRAGYEVTAPVSSPPCPASLRSSLRRPGIAARERRDAIEERRRAERTADRLAAAKRRDERRRRRADDRRGKVSAAAFEARRRRDDFVVPAGKRSANARTAPVFDALHEGVLLCDGIIKPSTCHCRESGNPASVSGAAERWAPAFAGMAPTLVPRKCRTLLPCANRVERDIARRRHPMRRVQDDRAVRRVEQAPEPRSRALITRTSRRRRSPSARPSRCGGDGVGNP